MAVTAKIILLDDLSPHPTNDATGACEQPAACMFVLLLQMLCCVQQMLRPTLLLLGALALGRRRRRIAIAVAAAVAGISLDFDRCRCLSSSLGVVAHGLAEAATCAHSTCAVAAGHDTFKKVNRRQNEIEFLHIARMG